MAVSGLRALTRLGRRHRPIGSIHARARVGRSLHRPQVRPANEPGRTSACGRDHLHRPGHRGRQRVPPGEPVAADQCGRAFQCGQPRRCRRAADQPGDPAPGAVRCDRCRVAHLPAARAERDRPEHPGRGRVHTEAGRRPSRSFCGHPRQPRQCRLHERVRHDCGERCDHAPRHPDLRTARRTARHRQPRFCGRCSRRRIHRSVPAAGDDHRGEQEPHLAVPVGSRGSGDARRRRAGTRRRRPGLQRAGGLLRTARRGRVQRIAADAVRALRPRGRLHARVPQRRIRCQGDPLRGEGEHGRGGNRTIEHRAAARGASHQCNRPDRRACDLRHRGGRERRGELRPARGTRRRSDRGLRRR